MQQDLTSIASSELVEMLVRLTEYDMALSKSEDNIPQRKLAQYYINRIIAEIKTREDYSDMFNGRS